jgi:hypothetical protein
MTTTSIKQLCNDDRPCDKDCFHPEWCSKFKAPIELKIKANALGAALRVADNMEDYWKHLNCGEE